MSFVYPRTVTVRRSNAQTGVGAIGYGGVTPQAETVELYKFSASIQVKQERSQQPAGLPSDPNGNLTGWVIFVRKAKLGDIKDNDIIEDDQGERYQVVANYWNSFGYRLICNRLKS
ncbi:MAG: hypothetical protein P4M09_16925 [Devosia sp.]|nr:hypothetical protein [Devosia sp.]